MASLRSALAESLPPETAYRLRSIKRAIMGQEPLPWPHKKPAPPAAPQAAHDGRIIQDIALENYINGTMPVRKSYMEWEDVLILAAQEIAKTLTLSVQYINGAHVLGDIAEFGTMSGSTARVIATSMVFDYRRQPLPKSAGGENPFRKLRMFDSFEGLPEITSPIDQAAPHVISGAWAKGGCHVLAADQLRSLIGKILPPHRFEIYEGWFADTVKTLPPETRFAMIHFDGDLYSSTMDALVPLFARGMISTGAILCFDDWNANRAIPDTGERRAWQELTEQFDIKASHCGNYACIGTRFIIHSYRGIPVDPV
jgi:hypothetical protein